MDQHIELIAALRKPTRETDNGIPLSFDLPSARAAEVIEELEQKLADLRKEMDKLWSQFVVQCESIEDRKNREPKTEHEKGFYRGEKDAAKWIRRSVAHPKYNGFDYPTYNGEA